MINAVKPAYLLNILEFHYDCNKTFVSLLEGNTSDKVFVFTEDLSSHNFNNLFMSNPLGDSVITAYSKRFHELDKTPAFNVIVGSQNDEKCSILGLKQSFGATWMAADPTGVSGMKLSENMRIVEQVLPYSDEFLAIFGEAFFVDENSRSEWITKFRKCTDDEGRVKLFVLENDGIPVSIAQSVQDTENKRAFLYNVATKPIYQRHGFCKILLSNVLRLAHFANIEQVFLDTETGSHAQHFYESLGFKNVGQTNLYIEES